MDDSGGLVAAVIPLSSLSPRFEFSPTAGAEFLGPILRRGSALNNMGMSRPTPRHRVSGAVRIDWERNCAERHYPAASVFRPARYTRSLEHWLVRWLFKAAGAFQWALNSSLLG
jgi:hypothetical protein